MASESRVNNKQNCPLIVIVGQTAAGKSDLAIQIAEKYAGEIICADSRTIYKGMDVGTAKPDVNDLKAVKHHLLDIIEPDTAYSAGDFKKDAERALNKICSAGKLPIIVGGTGLYINSLVYDFDFGRMPDQEYRTKLENLGMDELQKKVKDLGLSEHQINFKNKRHMIRAIENGGLVRTKKALRKDTLIVGIKTDKQALQRRIRNRIDNMLAAGLEDEVRSLADKYGWSAPGLNAIAYKEWENFFSGRCNLDQVKENMFKNNWQYARRQKIWFKKDPNIKWTTSLKSLIRQVDQFLIQY